MAEQNRHIPGTTPTMARPAAFKASMRSALVPGLNLNMTVVVSLEVDAHIKGDLVLD